MPVRTRYRIQAAISSSSTEERDLCNVSFEIVDDLQNEGGVWKSQLAVGATDVPINLGNIASAGLLILRTNAKDPTKPVGVVNIRLNSPTGEEIAIVPLGSTKEGHFLLSTSGLTALYATNTSATTDMEVTAISSGD